MEVLGSFLIGFVAVLAGALAAYFARGESRQVEQEARQNFDEFMEGLLAEAKSGGGNDDQERPRPVAEEVALMSKYHAQGLGQSRTSFIISVVFAALGFGVIVFALLTTDTSESVSQQSLPLISAVVLEAVASLFFVQSNRSQRVMVEFFDRLRADRRLEEALQLADKMPDPKLRGRMMLVLGLSLAQRPVTDELLSVLIDASTAEAMADRRGVVAQPADAESSSS